MLRTLAFGDLETGLWGVAGTSPAGAAASFADEFELDPGAPSEEWLAAAAGVELRFAPTTEPAPFVPSAPGIAGSLQLCEVRGAVHVDGVEREVACFGARAELTLPASDASSARLATAWFGADLGFALVSMRPQRTKGHEDDRVACAFIDDGEPLEIDDPRMSTTYAESGVPLRAGLELWPVEEEPEADAQQGPESDDGDEDDEGERDDGESPPTYYPRRIAGESARDASRLIVPALTIRAELFRWRMRGREAAGVYVIAPAP
jgi:hypothetical protein